MCVCVCVCVVVCVCGGVCVVVVCVREGRVLIEQIIIMITPKTLITLLYCVVLSRVVGRGGVSVDRVRGEREHRQAPAHDGILRDTLVHHESSYSG